MAIDYTGKRLGKLKVLGKIPRPTDWRGFKYQCTWYEVVCDCGNVRELPQAGLCNYRSCGCSRSDHLKSRPLPAVRHFPNKPLVLGTVKDLVYTDV